jgi:NAD(P)H-quinone oxidoreductase subunit 5
MSSLSPAVLSFVPSALATAIPFMLGAAAIAATANRPAGLAWRWARGAVGWALLFAVLSLPAVLVLEPVSAFSLRVDALGAIVLLLICFVGWVIVRYSAPYLAGEPREPLYVRWLLATLAAVTVVVVTNNLLVLALAWLASSLALHRLLTFYQSRSAALIAAHKKFIVSRIADVCVFGAVLLMWLSFDTLAIDEMMALAATAPQLSAGVHAAVVLISCAALLKCAQLPFHGWLIQVMEAPTPVSALLHAGVVNLGGFVLIRFAPLVSEVHAAQALLVVAGSVTAVIAALVMTTRISIKVMLAWSTCAQMGFMLMQIGLGAYQMALLHLVAHSLYKAHAFLGAGGVVLRANLRQMAPAVPSPTLTGLLGGLAIGAAMTATAAALWDTTPVQPAIGVLAGIVSVALVPLLWRHAVTLGRFWLPVALAAAFAVAFAYFGLHQLLSAWMPLPQAPLAPWLWIWVLACFALLFAVQSVVAIAPAGALSLALYPWFYGGLFLDERFSRVLFSVWPPRLPQFVPDPSARPAVHLTRGVAP